MAPSSVMTQNASLYFQKLSDLLTKIVVTEREGLSLSLEEGCRQVIQLISSLRGTSQKMMLIGNGGSAAIVSHMQNDLCKGVGVRALVFNEQPLLTALSNDIGYESVFEKPIELWANPGDLLLAISSSGRSQNILRAVQASRVRGCQIATLSGFREDNPLRREGDVNFYVSSMSYGLVEVAHMAIAHFLTDSAVAPK